MAAEEGGVRKRAHTEFEDGEIISEILARLPVKCVVRFRCVSKWWNSLISDPYFTKKHLRYAEMGITENSSRLLYSMDPPQSLDHEALKDLKDHSDVSFANRELGLPVMLAGYSNCYKIIVGSCNGLICIFVEGVDFMLWNPCTGYSKVLPRTPLPVFNPRGCCNGGFGYDSATDDYKLIVGTKEMGGENSIQVFTLKTSSWKVLPITTARNISGRGLFFNGALHWLARVSWNRQTILSFNLVEDKFHQMIPLPYDDGAYFRGMMIHGNCLCVYDVGRVVGRDGLNAIWLMKEYGVKQSWTQVIKFSERFIPGAYSHVCLWPICILESGELLVNNGSAGFLVLYDPKENTSKNVTKIHELNCGALVYRETLVSPVTGSVIDI